MPGNLPGLLVLKLKNVSPSFTPSLKSGTVALRSQGRRGIVSGIKERCWELWCLVESADVGVSFTSGSRHASRVGGRLNRVGAD